MSEHGELISQHVELVSQQVHLLSHYVYLVASQYVEFVYYFHSVFVPILTKK